MAKLRIRARMAVNLRYRNAFLIFDNTIQPGFNASLIELRYQKRHNLKHFHSKTVASTHPLKVLCLGTLGLIICWMCALINTFLGGSQCWLLNFTFRSVAEFMLRRLPASSPENHFFGKLISLLTFFWQVLSNLAGTPERTPAPLSCLSLTMRERVALR